LAVFFFKIHVAFKFLSTSTFLGVFIINRCGVLTDAFSLVYSFDHVVFFFVLLMWCISFTWVSDAKAILHIWNKSHLVLVYNPVYILLDSIW
jgi:hypothetical protein